MREQGLIDPAVFGSEARICVIGAGPRGICVAERLCANTSVPQMMVDSVVVHIVDPMVGAGGAVWSTGQSARLLMNTICSQVTIFSDDSVECEGPVRPGPSLYEWARFLHFFDPDWEYPEQVRAEAARLGPNDYSTRVCYGHYLNWALRQLIDRQDDRVTVVTHGEVATAVDDEPDGGQSVTLADGTRLSGLDGVILAQGHIGTELTPAEQRLAEYSGANGLYLPPGIPDEHALDAVRAGEVVALRGMGLTFFDYMVLLTEGRGGWFSGQPDRLVYHPSGHEPVLHAGSRRGVPYHARGDNEKGTFERHQPRFLTPEVIGALRDRARGGRPLVFRRDVWPLVAREVQSVYYATLVGDRHGARARDAFLTAYVPAVATGAEAETALLDRAGIAGADRWDWGRVARPHGKWKFASYADFHSWLLGYLEADLAEALRGNVHSPLKSALDVLRDLRNEVRLVVDHGGLTGGSYRDELRGWFTPLNSFLSIGPPALRIAQMIALVRAGVLHVVGPYMRVTHAADGSGFVVSSPDVDDAPVLASTLIDARLPEVDIRVSTDPLVRSMFSRRQCRAYRLPDGPVESYQTGGLSVTERPYHLVDAEGRVHPRRFAFGVPTEGVHWVTAAGVRPGVNSVIVGDADAIARASLLAARRLEQTSPHYQTAD